MLNESSQILWGKYIHKKNIGAGSYGDIVLVEYQQRQFAIKKIQNNSYDEKQTLILEQFDHPNILKLLGIDKRQTYVLILTEYCNKGDLLKYQKTLEKQVYSLEQGVEALYQIVLGLKCVHEKNIVHRDIKPANILANQEGSKLIYKIGDFGCSSLKNINKSIVGTEYYEAPQMMPFDGDKQYDKQIDIWSLGVTFYFMLNAKLPFCQKIQADRLAQIHRKCTPYYKYQSLNDKNICIEDLFRKIFVVEPRDRIKIQQLITHPLFEKFTNKFKPLQQELANQRQINNILLLLTNDIEKSKSNFHQIHHIALIYNLQKLYVINHYKIRNSLNELKNQQKYDSFCKRNWYASFTKTIQEQCISAYIKFLNQKQIEKAFQKSDFKIMIEQTISKTEFEGDFKIFYRMTTRVCHQNIKQFTTTDFGERPMLKFKILLCHGFNRIFQDHQLMLKKYHDWIKPSSGLTTELFEKWIKGESQQNIKEIHEQIGQHWFA